MYKETGILFVPEMVLQILTGNKIETRRIINVDQIKPSTWKHDSIEYIIQLHTGEWKAKTKNYNNFSRSFDCYYGKPDDLLYVRETWCKNGPIAKPYNYKADHLFGPYEKDFSWKPSIHMPKEAARIWLLIKSIKAERISEITEEDCIKEGVHFYEDNVLGRRYKDYLAPAIEYGHPCIDYPTVSSARESFFSLWEKINGEPKPIQKKENGKTIITGYEVYPLNEEKAKKFTAEWKGKPLKIIINPFVWAISFEVIYVNQKF